MSATGDAASPVLRPLAAAGWMALACLLFSIMSLCAKVAMATLPWHEVAAGRAAFGALTIYVWARGRSIPLKVHDRRTQWLRTSAGVVSMSCGFYALSRLAMGDAVTLANLTPLMIAIASKRALDERAGAGLAIAVILGFFGVALLAGARLHEGPGAIVAIAAAISGALFSCIAMLFLRRLGGRESAEGVSLHFLAWSAGAMLAMGVGRHVLPTPAAAASLLLAGVSGGLAQIFMTRAYGLDKAARVGAISYLGVVLSQLFGVLALHEFPGVRQLGGAALVVLSGAFLVFGAVREHVRSSRAAAIARPEP